MFRVPATRTRRAAPEVHLCRREAPVPLPLDGPDARTGGHGVVTHYSPNHSRYDAAEAKNPRPTPPEHQ
jgi:hypothetical protein